jgi:hypothetical protein
MGRGRAKAKQTKVARQLKYSTGDLDVSKLSAELGADAHHESADYDDPYADQDPDDEGSRREA